MNARQNPLGRPARRGPRRPPSVAGVLRRLFDWVHELIYGSPEPAPDPVPVRVRR